MAKDPVSAPAHCGEGRYHGSDGIPGCLSGGVRATGGNTRGNDRKTGMEARPFRDINIGRQKGAHKEQAETRGARGGDTEDTMCMRGIDGVNPGLRCIL